MNQTDDFFDIHGDPYRGDILGRKNFGMIMSDRVKLYSDGIVMALNGKWGSGKTTFVKMWQQQMKNEGYETIYYNAWENDYISDPLIGLISEFNEQTEIPGRKKVMKFTNYARKVGLKMIPSLASSAAKSIIGMDLEATIKDASKEAIDILDEIVAKYSEEQNSIKEFRKTLADFVQKVSPEKPIIFIIDELDRCKPDFAVKTLERIKHLFAVKKVVFVLAIDRVQLEHSICGYYGSDLIDAGDYLRRFFEPLYNIPTGNIQTLVTRTIKDYKITKFILDSNAGILIRNASVYEDFHRFVESIYLAKRLSIRQLKKWMLELEFVLGKINDTPISIETKSFLVYLYVFDPTLFSHIINRNLGDEEILKNLVYFFSYILLDRGNSMNYNIFGLIAEVFRLRYYRNDSLFYKRVIDQNHQIKMNLDFMTQDEIIILQEALERSSNVVIKPLDYLDQYFQ